MTRLLPSRSGVGRSRTQQGAGLLEVLIAVLVMGIGLLGIAALQATALRNAQSSMERSQAVVQAYAILDSMRANASVARAGGYDRALTTACALPTGSTLVDNDVSAWLLGMRKSMGAGACGGISCSAATCTVQVRWDDSRASIDATKATAEKSFTVTTRTRL